MAVTITEQMDINGDTSRTALNGRTVNNDRDGTFTVYSESKLPQIFVGPDPDTGYSAIKLYDLQGVELIALAVDANGVPYLSFSNADAVEVVNISAGANPHLDFKNTSGTTTLTIGLTGSAANPTVKFNNANGSTMMTMGLAGSNTTPLIEMTTASGTKQITIGEDAAAGQNNFSVYDDDGKRIIYVGVDPKGGTEPVMAATEPGIDVLTELNR